jgi:hypothetical protein
VPAGHQPRGAVLVALLDAGEAERSGLPLSLPRLLEISQIGRRLIFLRGHQ